MDSTIPEREDSQNENPPSQSETAPPLAAHVQAERLKKWRFQPGNKLGGRTKGTVGGRQAILKAFDVMTKEPEVVKAVLDGLRAYAKKYPVRFFTNVMMPLFPKEMIVASREDGNGVTWTSLLQGIPAAIAAEERAERAGPPPIDAECRDVTPQRHDNPAAVASEREPGCAADEAPPLPRPAQGATG